MAKKIKDKIPESLTPSCVRFFDSQKRLADFLGYLLSKIHQTEGDEAWKLDALISQISSPDSKKGKSSAEVKQIEEHIALMCELIACRSVDNFLIYLSELLALVLKVHPGVLDLSKVQIDLAFVLSQPDVQAVRNMYMEKKVREMSYWSLKDLSGYLKDKFKFKLFYDDGERNSATNLIEERNLLVHNQGIVDKIFKDKAPTHSANIGDRIRYSPKRLMDSVRLIEQLAVSIDQRAVTQWSALPTKKHSFEKN